MKYVNAAAVITHRFCFVVADELRLKQQEIRKKKLEDLKCRDDERQRAAEERRKKREQEEEVSSIKGYLRNIA